MATTMNTACPRCGSNDTASVRSVYEHGTQDRVGDSAAYGVYADTSSTHAAQRVAPPGGRYPSNGTVLIVIGGVMALLILIAGIGQVAAPPAHVGHYDPPPTSRRQYAIDYGLAFAPFAAIAVLGLVIRSRAVRYNRTVLPSLHATWSQRWTCRRCGEVWVPTAD